MTSSKPIRPADRTTRLKVQQTLKMARSAHAYVRGSTVQFYQWLKRQKRGSLPEGPPVWICGDCHAGNLGPVASVDGRVAIQIRDLDQTVIGNPTHDIIRLAAFPGDGFTRVRPSRRHHRAYSGTGYRRLSSGVAARCRADRRPTKIRDRAMRQSVARSWKHLARERLKTLNPTIPLGRNSGISRRPKEADVESSSRRPALRHLAVSLRSRDDDAEVEVLDAAYWMKGCSSLGKLGWRFSAAWARARNVTWPSWISRKPSPPQRRAT